ncbi:MAG: AzlD domain-containing protein [Rhodospirillales bacterium]|jgi:branched-subunit amino acid transport protein|nr:AzlD domain-containing protein [Rhodospirillales bacterium]MBT4040971.1 AzlD domain-containing protein [Rhodospirillales bacterium]MBT4625627.1 AzlD domain-containing protein [Rhodospirillales bacterium]MBT5350204.1 AzlD domain-containing protein [Rhodospirillales bacterium]MBT5522014.1 AzlD domain-containing protein [Rhodospirillales bacterium]
MTQDMMGVSIWIIVGASVAATYFWRGLGMIIASRLHPDSKLSRWFACVAYAVLAGFIARMLILPEGSLAEVPLLDKLIPVACGFGVIFLFKRTSETGTVVAFLTFVAIALWRGYGVA